MDAVRSLPLPVLPHRPFVLLASILVCLTSPAAADEWQIVVAVRDAVAARDNVWTATFPEVVDTYRGSAEFLAPQRPFAASFYDSLLSLGHQEFGRMWARQPLTAPADRGGATESWRP